MKKTFYWISVQSCTNFKGISVQPSEENEAQDNKDCLKHHLFFDNKEQASAFLIELKKAIKKLYVEDFKQTSGASWMDEKWINNIPDAEKGE